MGGDAVPSAISSTISILKSGKASRNGPIQRRTVSANSFHELVDR